MKRVPPLKGDLDSASVEAGGKARLVLLDGHNAQLQDIIV